MIGLDTNVCIEILRGTRPFENLLAKFHQETFAITVPTVFELYLGLYQRRFLKKKISNAEFLKLERDLQDFIAQMIVFQFDTTAATTAARIYMELKGAGKETQVFDCIIGSILLSNNCVRILTDNREHFENFKGLAIVNWDGK